MQSTCTVLSSVTCPTLPYFFTLSHKRHDLLEKVNEHKIGVLIFSTTYLWCISHSKNNSTRCYHKGRHVCMYSIVIFVRFWWNLNFTNRFCKKNIQISVFYENPSSGSRVIPCERTERRAWQPIVAFRNFTKVPKNLPLECGMAHLNVSWESFPINEACLMSTY